VGTAVITGQIPTNTELAQYLSLGERKVRDIRLALGLNRRDITAWHKPGQDAEGRSPEQEILTRTPFAGLWLLVH
jgi:hypothetical protein